MGRGMILVVHVHWLSVTNRMRIVLYKKKKYDIKGMKYDELLHE